MVSDDFKNVCVATMIPGVGFVAGMAAFASDEALVKWFNDLKRPSFAPKPLWAYMVGDTLAMAPIGCASYLVYKHGGGLDYTDTKLALGAYALTMAVGMSGLIYMKRRCLKGLFMHSAGTTVGSYVTAFLFHRIHPTAGHLMLPLCLWSTFSTYLMHEMAGLNDAKCH